jgi:transposase
MEAIMNIKLQHTPKQLQTLYQSQKDAKMARRIQAIYLSSKGLTCLKIMEITGAARRTVQQWLFKYNHGGIEALRDSPRSGQPVKLRREMEQAFCERIDVGPTKADGVCVFNGPAIRRLLEREFGVLYSTPGLYDMLHRLGFSCLCPRPRHEKSDPKVQEEFKKNSSKRWIRFKQSIQTRK